LYLFVFKTSTSLFVIIIAKYAVLLKKRANTQQQMEDSITKDTLSICNECKDPLTDAVILLCNCWFCSKCINDTIANAIERKKTYFNCSVCDNQIDFTTSMNDTLIEDEKEVYLACGHRISRIVIEKAHNNNTVGLLCPVCNDEVNLDDYVNEDNSDTWSGVDEHETLDDWARYNVTQTRKYLFIKERDLKAVETAIVTEVDKVTQQITSHYDGVIEQLKRERECIIAKSLEPVVAVTDNIKLKRKQLEIQKQDLKHAKYVSQVHKKKPHLRGLLPNYFSQFDEYIKTEHFPQVTPDLFRVVLPNSYVPTYSVINVCGDPVVDKPTIMPMHMVDKFEAFCEMTTAKTTAAMSIVFVSDIDLNSIKFAFNGVLFKRGYMKTYMFNVYTKNEQLVATDGDILIDTRTNECVYSTKPINGGKQIERIVWDDSYTYDNKGSDRCYMSNWSGNVIVVIVGNDKMKVFNKTKGQVNDVELSKLSNTKFILQQLPDDNIKLRLLDYTCNSLPIDVNDLTIDVVYSDEIHEVPYLNGYLTYEYNKKLISYVENNKPLHTCSHFTSPVNIQFVVTSPLGHFAIVGESCMYVYTMPK
jgi:hypothetical protein